MLKQQDFLKEARARLGVTWDEMAELTGIHPRALKTYRMPDASTNFRIMPSVAYKAVENVLALKEIQEGATDAYR